MNRAQTADLGGYPSLVYPEAILYASGTEARPGTLGAMPLISTFAMAGLVAIALADNAARSSLSWALPAWWAGFLLIVTPITIRVMARDGGRTERIALILLLSLALYAIKVLQSPVGFTYNDELLHVVSVNNILSMHHLFTPNTVLPVGPFYPGIELVASALTAAGIPLFTAGLLIAAASRLLLALTLFLLFEGLSQSARVASIGILVYASCQNFLFFDAQFAYETLALPMAVVALWLFLSLTREHYSGRLSLSIAGLLVVCTVVITHHVTGFALAGILGVWWAAARLHERAQSRTAALLEPVALLAPVLLISWIVFVATFTIGYLSNSIVGGAIQLLRLIAGEQDSRQLFKSYAGQISPWPERAAGYVAVLLTVTGVIAGARIVWARYRDTPLMLGFAILALGYLGTLPLRLTPRGVEIADRATEFFFISVALVIALALSDLHLPRFPVRQSRGVAVIWLLLLLVGGAALSRPPWLRLPGAYLVEADTRSIEPRDIAAARWMDRYLGPAHNILADRVNSALAAAYGHETPVTSVSANTFVARVMFEPRITLHSLSILQSQHIRYILVDYRMTKGLPLAGYYFSSGEPEGLNRHTPLPKVYLSKFNASPDIDRIFSDGEIVIYRLAGAPHAR